MNSQWSAKIWYHKFNRHDHRYRTNHISRDRDHHTHGQCMVFSTFCKLRIRANHTVHLEMSSSLHLLSIVSQVILCFWKSWNFTDHVFFFWSRTNRRRDWLCSFQSQTYRQKSETTNLVILQLICCSWVNFIKSNQFVSYHRLRAKYECIKLTVWLHFCKIDHFTVLQLGNFN